MFSFEQVKELIAFVAEQGVEAVEIERGGFRLRIVGKTTSVRSGSAPGAIRSVPGRGSEAPAGGVGELPADVHILTSPIVGTFYGAPNPEAEPYVRHGDRVKKGQVLCIIEAMKLMNDIESDVDGVVAAVFPKNAQPVEFGTPLFAIRT